MRLHALAPVQKLLLAAAAAAFLALASTPSSAQEIPEAARLAYVSGAVSIQPAGIDNWGQASPNLPLGPGDRIATDSDGRAEIQLGQTFIRIGPNSDFTYVESNTAAIALGLARGTVHIHNIHLLPGQSLNVNTPNGNATVNEGGEFRVDVVPDQDSTVISSFFGNVTATGAGGFNQLIQNTQALQLAGTNPVASQWLEFGGWDDLDHWSQSRDQIFAHPVSFRYVSPYIAGAAELDANGEWMPASDYGAVWFPRVAAGWAPYHNGHWVNHAPWGWMWVEDESWGYAPFHYGRWVAINGRWGWIPGPPAAHPVFAPALVVFAGGIHFGGVGVSVWFPLGPGEPYRPWYPCSPRHIDEINISNITESRVVHVQTTYVNIVKVTNITYVNRTVGVTAMNHSDFASGRSAAQVAVKVDVHQMDHVTALERPEPQPTAASFVGKTPARPVPVKTERPALINAQGKLASAKPGAKPMEAPVKAAPVIKSLPGRKIAAPPPGVKAQPAKAPAAAAKPTKPEEKAAPVAPVKPEAKKPAPETKPAAKPAEKPETKPETKPAVKPAEKPETKPEAKPAVKPETKPADKPEAKQPAPATATGAKPAAKPADKNKKTDKKKDEEKKPE